MKEIKVDKRELAKLYEYIHATETDYGGKYIPVLTSHPIDSMSLSLLREGYLRKTSGYLMTRIYITERGRDRYNALMEIFPEFVPTRKDQVF